MIAAKVSLVGSTWGISNKGWGTYGSRWSVRMVVLVWKYCVSSVG